MANSLSHFAVFNTAGFPVAFFNNDIYPDVVEYGAAPEPSEDDPDPAPPEVARSRNPAIPTDAIDLTEDQWREFLNHPGERRWSGSDVEAFVPPPPPPAIPASISDRQFAQVLALDGVITKIEARAWAARGDLPDRLEEILLQIPEEGDRRFSAEMLLSSATTYERGHPLVPALGGLLGYDAAALDDLWIRGGAL